MQVIFIHHSCFLVEVDEKVLIFDWFAGDRVNGFTFHGQIPEYEPAHNLNIIAHFVLYRQGIQRLLFKKPCLFLKAASILPEFQIPDFHV
jgi:L-ascorbate metabolism protein UlaG (beta-lactamase superfamily)